MKRFRRSWIVAGIAAVLVPVGIAYGLSTSGSRVSCLDWSARVKSASTSSTTWTDVPGMRVKNLLAENFAVQVSATVSGSNVQFRVTDAFVGGTFALAPGGTTFAPGTGPNAFAYTWVGTNPAEHQHVFTLQWRVKSGTATLRQGDITALYQGAPTPGACS
ncbi:MAG: hypothetical protein ACM3OO_07355 [Planctomycetaceae bacterium]